MLRKFLNDQWKRAHKIPFNPVYAVELEPETRDAPLVWDPAQVAHFLDFTADDRLALLWRLVLLRGFRRGEICALGRRRRRHRPRRSHGQRGARPGPGKAGMGQAEVEGRRARRRPGQGQRGRGQRAPDAAQARAPGRRRGVGRLRADVHRRARRARCTRSTSPAGSASWRRRPGCRSSSSTRPGTPRRRWRSRRASTSRSCPSSSATPRPGSPRTFTSTSGTRCTWTRPRRSSTCCPDARERGRQDHDRMRPFCVRPGRPTQSGRVVFAGQRRAWDSNPR